MKKKLTRRWHMGISLVSAWIRPVNHPNKITTAKKCLPPNIHLTQKYAFSGRWSREIASWKTKILNLADFYYYKQSWKAKCYKRFGSRQTALTGGKHWGNIEMAQAALVFLLKLSGQIVLFYCWASLCSLKEIVRCAESCRRAVHPGRWKLEKNGRLSKYACCSAAHVLFSMEF